LNLYFPQLGMIVFLFENYLALANQISI